MYAMNQNYNPGDPSALVPNSILGHVHLVSSYRFPNLPQLQPAQALEYLIKGPTIVKDTAAVAWTYFPSPPPDGTVLLTWQPPRMGTNFASDGLVWADPEMAYDMQIRGYNLQVLIHKSGFHYPNEPFATHARYRYRITHGPGHTDPNLWVVHYSMADPASRIPASQIGIQRDVHAIMQTRQQLEAAGQLIRKEFMLADRANWPKVEFTRAAGQQPPYYNPMQPGRAYNQPPPNKRARPSLPAQGKHGPIPAMVADTSLEEEENSTQDSFDFLTPRDISVSRYKQHHEWMEEIFNSPHAIGKILPIDLGLGLMGELTHLTAGILDTPGGAHPTIEFPSIGAQRDKKDTYKVKSYNKLHPEQLKDFEARVSAYTKQEEAELDKLRAAHLKKMANLKRSRTYIKAERRLRDVSRKTSESVADENESDPLETVVNDLEKSVGVTFDTKKSVDCVDKGGFIEEQRAPTPKPQQVNGNGTQSNADTGSNGLTDAIDTENNAADLLDQFGSNSLTGTPGGGNLSVPAISQPQSQSQSAVATPSAPAVDAVQSTTLEEQANIGATSGADDLLDLDVDVEMSGMANTDEKTADDWVMVDNSTNNAQEPANTEQAAVSSSEPPADSTVAATSTADADVTTSMFDTADFGAFDNLDSAGDALADYTNVDDDNMGLDLVDDSAFGDAFHGTEMHHDETEGDNA